MLFFVTNVLEMANLFNQRLRELPFCESLLTEYRNVIAAQYLDCFIFSEDANKTRLF